MESNGEEREKEYEWLKGEEWQWIQSCMVNIGYNTKR